MFSLRRAFPVLLSLCALALFLLLEWIGGMTWPLDVAAIRASGPWRADHPTMTRVVVAYTHLGSGVFLLTLTAAAAALLWLRGQRMRATVLAFVVMGGRLGIELIKLFVDRPRPGLEVHPVAVHAQSFPSAHAGNSMLTFLALALFVAPERWRTLAVTLAVAGAFSMGATRPLLGVHWPTDVVAGWIYGATLALLAWSWFKRQNGRSAA